MLSIDSKDEGNVNKSYDVHYLTELQKNPLTKRIFTKISQTSTSILVLI